jgi:hypothetical protein
LRDVLVCVSRKTQITTKGCSHVSTRPETGGMVRQHREGSLAIRTFLALLRCILRWRRHNAALLLRHGILFESLSLQGELVSDRHDRSVRLWNVARVTVRPRRKSDSDALCRLEPASLLIFTC